jgi:TonB-linked SusC/RagA family outer membrane protein
MLLLQREELVKSGQSNTFRHLLAAGTVHYGKAGKYFADLSFAYNGTNLLPKGSRTGLFPALSIGWNVSNEEWFSRKQVFDYLKLRASWGMTGSDQVIQNINMNPWDGGTGYYFRYNNIGSGGYREGRLASSPLTFETSYKTNIGIDASMFKLLDLNLDVFYNKRKGILVETGGSISGVLGAYEPYSSAGITTNKGIELGLNLHQETGLLKYHLSGQLSYIKSKIIDMLEVYRPEEYLKRTGQSINQAFGLEATGFFASDDDIADSPSQTFSVVRPGDIKYKDQNGDDIINSFDEIPIGYNTEVPELYYSGSLGLEFKGVGFDMFFQGIANQTIYLNTPSIFIPLRSNTNISTFSDDVWTPASAATATLPRLSALENANNYQPNSIWYVDGSYLKLRSAELYFDLPGQMASRLKLNEVRIYFRGMNLLSIDNIKIVDPEEIGITHPTMSSYNLGIKIGF